MRLVMMLCAMAAMPLSAQGTSALRGHDSSAPIDVDAQRIEVLDAANQAIFTGKVRVRQAKMTLDANRIKVSYTRPANGDPVIRRLDADGAVRLVTPSEQATGRFGIYDVENRLVTLVGDVTLAQGASNLRGNRLSIDLRSGRSTMDGQGGRVTGRFTVAPRKTN